ncbi:MAG: hypothetical protein DLM67_26365 [Candidatus Nephthysia bennettiae]|uniref:Uncharacterized protein n=1 Tax=Candidatus Nephthysia bennettiae TaxID=3127016 RepID=A0A934N957_9BACT|nr:hypothetical protein [Candidatus Dormibacteraeota bacterium]MBJ7615082.1 hypothetical protein [Candidatus Dormibacteraeota bacterium]PZR85119.1 MAG: hypothetical protein DLM67_26365 [Candidatus Dormibacteraeota bacterium]
MFPRTPKFYLGIVGALLAAGSVVTVTSAASGLGAAPAASASPKPSASPSAAQAKRQAYCTGFVNHLASDLGKKPDQVNKAISDALSQTLADAVKAGDLTQQQADAIKARKNGSNVCSSALAGIGHGARAKARIGMAEYAKALGISQQELKQDLAGGKTLKDVAASKGMDETTFRNNLVNAARSDLDPRVASGKLTQQQEDTILNKIKTGPLPLWDRPAKRAGAAPTASPSPSATP